MKQNRPVYQNPLTGRCPYHAHCSSPAPFMDHWHGEIELLYLLPESGPVTICIDGTPTVLHARDLYLVDSSVIHRVETVNADSLMLVLEMGFGLLGEDFQLFARHRFSTPRLSFSDNQQYGLTAMESLLLEIANEPVVRDFAHAEDNTPEAMRSRMRVASGLFRLAVMLTDMPFTEVNTTHIRQIQSMLSVQMVLNYMRDHYNRTIHIEQAAAMVGYEKTRFCQLFKNAVGVSFHQYLTDCRMKASLPLLRDTALQINSIAEFVGIPQSKSFSRLFRHRFGITPSEYRTKNTVTR